MRVIVALLGLGLSATATSQAIAEPPDSVKQPAGAACARAATLTKIKGKPRDTALPVLMLRYDEKTSEWTRLETSEDLTFTVENRVSRTAADFKPANAEAVRGILCVKVSEPILMSTYSNGAKGYGFDVDLRLVEWPSGKPLAQLSRQATPPDIAKNPYAQRAKVDGDVVARWLASAIAWR